jgi:hypothetical protein
MINNNDLSMGEPMLKAIMTFLLLGTWLAGVMLINIIYEALISSSNHLAFCAIFTVATITIPTGGVS